MKNKHYKFSLLFALCSLHIAACTGTAQAATPFPDNGARAGSPGFMSQYGQIQNVQNYSSNPFWNPNSPYNQRMPVPVYAQGTELNAEECRNVATSVVASQCGMRNNCSGAKLMDIKPAVMVQLSQMTGHNYVTACGGFVDTAFNDYVAQYGGMSGHANFPTAVMPGNNKPGPEFKIDNPYAPQLPEWSGEEWKKDIINRAVELDKLQTQNGGATGALAHADMPTTIADLSFTERMENTRAGLEPWAPVYAQVCDSAGKNCRRACVKNCAYQTIGIESDEIRYKREADERRAFCEARQINNGLERINADLARAKDCKVKKIKPEDCKLMGQY